MTEPAPRPASTRSRGSGRGGRGGSRGSTRPRDRQTNGDHKDAAPADDITNQGELGEMKKQYSSQLLMLKEMFLDWTDVDLLFALQETNGDLSSTIERITEGSHPTQGILSFSGSNFAIGHVSQFSDVKKTKERAKPKSKEATSDAATTSSKTARGRGAHDSARGTRGRSDRGRGGTRGGRGGHTAANGARSAGEAKSVATPDASWNVTTAGAESTDATSWDTGAAAEGAGSGQWESVATKATSASETAKASLVQGPPKQTWAQMLSKPTLAPPPQKLAQAPGVESTQPLPAEDPLTAAAAEQNELPIPPIADELPLDETLEEIPGTEDISIDLPPSKDQLTEDNVEHLPDSSHPPPTETAASTIDSNSATPSVVAQSQQVPIGRPVLGGFATSAHRATATPRSASFQRRFMEQQEAVVMPGNHAIDRTAVQFGSMGLNGDVEPDVDEDREDAETRTQPPQHSPTSQPRASLPPAPRGPTVPAEPPLPESIQASKPAPGLPAGQQQQPGSQPSPSAQLGAQPAAQQASQTGQPYNQFGRLGQNVPSDVSAPQKAYDLFGQQQSQQSAFDNFPAHSQAPSQSQQQSHLGGFSSGPNDYSSYYTSDQPRNAYQNYYGNAYGQQGTSAQQDAGASQQRTGSAFGASTGDASFPSSQPQQVRFQHWIGTLPREQRVPHSPGIFEWKVSDRKKSFQAPSRFAETQQSGHTTPNPTLGGPLQAGAQSQPMHQQPHTQTQHGAGYPYGNYYNNPYYASYMNQYSYGQGGFGGPFGKGSIYGGPHHGYGMSPHSSYDQQSSSPANVGGFGQSSLHDRNAGLGGGLGEYGRSNSTQPSQNQASGAGAFGTSMQDVFGRSQSGFPSQNQPYSQQQSATQQSGAGAAAEDALKPFGDSKNAAGGPSPSSLAQPGRPGSAANQQSGLPPPQQGFGGYPGQFNQMQSGQSQYSGLGGLGGHQSNQSHQAGGYGGYGGGFGNTYGTYARGGWGGNYGH